MAQHLCKNAEKPTLWQRYGHWIYALILPAYLIGFFYMEATFDGTIPYWSSYMPIDDLIPFCEWFYPIYILWFPLLGAVGFHLVFTSPRDFKYYMLYIGISFGFALILFAVFPNGQDLRPDLATLGRDNLWIRAIGFLYQTDTNTNVCPSVHVVGSMAVIFGVFHNDRLGRLTWFKITVIVMAVLISCSTVFIKQHSLLDVIVAVPYSFIMYGAVYWLPRCFTRRKQASVTIENP